LLTHQRQYGERAPGIETKYQRYARLAHQAQHGAAEFQERSPEGRPPSFILAPYFFFGSFNDPWWPINESILNACVGDPNAHEVSPVLAVLTTGLLGQALDRLPSGLASTTFFWINGFDERSAAEVELRTLAETVESHSSERRLVNLYGGFFSVCLAKVGLWGFNNGLGYSEARSWPDLPATGAAPARYYVPNLHSYLSAAVAQQLIDADPWFACDCPVCLDAGSRVPVVRLGQRYHDLKRHFALARHNEVMFVDQSSHQELVAQLREASQRVDRARQRLPGRVRIESGFLLRWARVIEEVMS
jgi:hypothetical protein